MRVYFRSIGQNGPSTAMWCAASMHEHGHSAAQGCRGDAEAGLWATLCVGLLPLRANSGRIAILTYTQGETLKGQAVNLLRVAAEESVDAAVRQVASISFKNLCRRSWDVEGATQCSRRWYCTMDLHAH